MFLEQQIRQVKLSRTFYWLGIAALSIYFLVQFGKFLKPFVIALLIWFLIKDLSRLMARVKLNGKSLPSWIRGLMSLSVILGIMFGIFEIVSSNVQIIQDKLPEYEEQFDDLVFQIGQITGVEDVTKRIRDIDLRSNIAGAVGTATTFVGNFIIIAIYVAFLLIEDTVFSKKVEMLFTDKHRHIDFQHLIDRMAKSVHTYISAKTIISLLTGLLSYIVLIIWGVDLAVLWAFIIFLLNYIPYVGSFVATFLPALFAVFQFNDMAYFVWIFLSVELVQLFVGNVVEPRFMGKSLNLSPLVVILSLSFWGLIWGVLGMILSVPIAAIGMIILAEIPGTRNIARMMSEKGILTVDEMDEQAGVTGS